MSDLRELAEELYRRARSFDNIPGTGPLLYSLEDVFELALRTSGYRDAVIEECAAVATNQAKGSRQRGESEWHIFNAIAEDIRSLKAEADEPSDDKIAGVQVVSVTVKQLRDALKEGEADKAALMRKGQPSPPTPSADAVEVRAAVYGDCKDCAAYVPWGPGEKFCRRMPPTPVRDIDHINMRYEYTFPKEDDGCFMFIPTPTAEVGK